MTSKDYQNRMALKIIRSFVNDLYEKTGMKATVKIDRLSLPKEEAGDIIVGGHVMSLEVLEARFIESIPFKIDANPLRARSRKGEYVDLRCIFSHIACKHLGFQLTSVGRYLKKDHTSIIHMCRRGDNLLKYDEKFIALYDDIFTKINNYVYFSESNSAVYNPERVLPTTVH